MRTTSPRSYARQSVDNTAASRSDARQRLVAAANAPSGDGSYGASQRTIRLLAICGLLCIANIGFSQESSLFHQPPPTYPTAQRLLPNGALPMAGPAAMQSPQGNYPQPTGGLAQASWTYVPPAPLRQYSIHDIVTIRVDEIARMRAEGSAENRKNSL